jgi:hypothetical protein
VSYKTKPEPVIEETIVNITSKGFVQAHLLLEKGKINNKVPTKIIAIYPKAITCVVVSLRIFLNIYFSFIIKKYF